MHYIERWGLVRVRLSFFKGQHLARRGEKREPRASQALGYLSRGALGKCMHASWRNGTCFPIHACVLLGHFHVLGASIPQPEDLWSKLMWFLRSKSVRGNGMPDIPRKVICSLLEESESFLVENTVVPLSGQVKVITWISSSLLDERDFNVPGP